MTTTARPAIGLCYMCHKTTESPRIVMFDPDLMDKVRICSDICLDKYRTVQSKYRLDQIKISKESKESDKVILDIVIEDL